MLLSTLAILTAIGISFTLPLFFPSVIGYRFLTIFGSILFLITGVTILVDGEGIARENGIVRTNETSTAGDTFFVEETIAKEISEYLTYSFGIGYMLIGLAIFFFSTIPRERDETHPVDNEVSDEPIGPLEGGNNERY